MSRSTSSPPQKKEAVRPPASPEPTALEKFSDNARQGVMSFLKKQKDVTAQRLSSLSERIHEAADGLQKNLPGSAASYISRAAERLERVTSHVTDSDIDQLMTEAETFVRKRPGLCLAGAIGGGFVIGRLLRSPSTSEMGGDNRG